LRRKCVDYYRIRVCRYCLARAQVAELFASEIAGCDDADTLLDALVVATGWATWESLRTDIHLDVEAARKALALWLSRLLSG